MIDFNIELSPEQMAEYRAKLAAAGAKKPAPKPKPDRSKPLEVQFFQFPAVVLEKIILTTHNAELAVLAQLYETWFINFKKNPIKLTSTSLKRYGISKDQKWRALQSLEKSGQITVERRTKKNPLITLNWQALKK
jgi:hypothetical protein